MQEGLGLASLQHGLHLRLSLTKMLSFIKPYIIEVADNEGKSDRGAEAVATLNYMYKACNFDAGRKIRPHIYSDLLNWVKARDAAGKLTGTLTGEPWNLPIGEASSFVADLRTGVAALSDPKRFARAAQWRNAVNTTLTELAARQPGSKVWAVCVVRLSCSTPKRKKRSQSEVECALQGMTVILREWARQIAEAVPKEDIVDMSIVRETWPEEWGTAGSHTGTAPYTAAMSDQPANDRPCAQQKHSFLTAPPPGEFVSSILQSVDSYTEEGFRSFEKAHNVAVWRVPVPDCADDDDVRYEYERVPFDTSCFQPSGMPVAVFLQLKEISQFVVRSDDIRVLCAAVAQASVPFEC